MVSRRCLRALGTHQGQVLPGRWKQGTRVDIAFYARGRAKSQIAVQVSRPAKKADVEPVRRSWKEAALERLQSLLEE
jgi:cobalamin biosynthesis protein CbiG